MPNNKQKFLLCIDDEAAVTMAFERAFEAQQEWVLDIAKSVREALEKLAHAQYNFIFLDIAMEGDRMAGMRILREINRIAIRGRSRGQSIIDAQIVCMSGSVCFDDIMVEANSLECVIFIKKPINFSAEYVRRILNKIGIALMPPQSASSPP